MRSIDVWCRDNRHIKIGEQQQKLNEKLRGHYAYYGVTGNSACVVAFPVCGQNVLAEVALPPQPPAFADMERVLSPPPALPAGPGMHLSFALQTRSEPMI